MDVTLCSSVSEKLKWMSRLLDIENKRRIHVSKLKTAIELLDQLQDAIPDEHYDNPEEYLKDKKPTEMGAQEQRSQDKRMILIRSFVTPDIHDFISIRTFRAIPPRLISAREF